MTAPAPTPRRGPGFAGVALTLVLLGMLAASLFGLVAGWRRVDVDLGFHGWLAVIAGSVISIALGVGLMALSYHSARAGYDDRQTPEPPPTPDREGNTPAKR